jgi:hypothetical protein
MPCEEWSWIVFQYRSSVRMYSKAAGLLGGASGGAGFNKAWEQSEDARKATDALRAALLEHEHKHGCQIALGPAIETRVERAGSRMSLGLSPQRPRRRRTLTNLGAELRPRQAASARKMAAPAIANGVVAATERE